MRIEAVLDDMAEQVDGARVRELVRLLLSMPAPWGRERKAAEAVAGWISAAAPTIRADVEVLSDERANVVVDAGGGPRQLLVCSHLDTSLTGLPDRDEVITGGREPPAQPDTDGDVLTGSGLGVARGPAAAATIGHLAAVAALERVGATHHSSLLLSAGGTHHRLGDGRRDHGPAQFGTGVLHALAQRPAPDAVVIAKAGPTAILHEEPGSAYLDIELRGRLLAAMARGDDGGLIGRLPVVLDAFERWRAGLLARPAVGQIGREAAVGAIDAGSPDKCDLLPAVARLSAYVVLGHGDLAAKLAGELEETIRAALPADGSVRVAVTVGPWVPAGRTPRDAPVVQAALAATGLDTEIVGWRGSTDGAVFRAAGIDTVRWGPTITAEPDDPRVDRVGLADLVAAARTYGEIVVRYAIDGEPTSSTR
jgi:acetylornithine deacetylase/succinyl-diaminopimelate desuccinylase-like protein